METSRFFVANLSPNTKEKDLINIFQDYGEVTRVELKTKESLVDPENLKVLAFVTLKINADDAQYCLDEVNWRKINGDTIKVSLAKESFLDRLKRERAEAEAATDNSGTTATEHSSELLTKNLENTRKKFADDEEFNDDDIAPELLITKKRAASSLHNGKIVIQSFDTTPIHVIEAKKHVKHLDEKSSTADKKRKESLIKMKNDYNQKKSAIQHALSGLNGSTAKKIKFSDAEDDEPAATISENKHSKPKTDIFGNDNDEPEEYDVSDLNLKPEHFGKKGERLLQMQSNQSLDPRFKIDAKFVGDDDDDEDGPKDEMLDESEKGDDIENERNWQMGILEQVVGTKLDTGNAAEKAGKNKKMLRYDPAKDDHQKFLRTKQETIVGEKGVQNQKKKKGLTSLNEEEINNKESADVIAPEVSKEVFYMVTDTLAESLRTRGDGFSLLNIFGKPNELEKREDQLKKVSNERILVNKTDKNALNPFTYDSSSDSDNEEVKTESSRVQDEKATSNQKQKQKVKIVMETFFIPKNDARLKEGAKFFKSAKKDAPAEDYEEVRNRLKLLIRTKITKTKKNLIKK